MQNNQKPTWQVLSDVADILTDPIAKANAKATAEKMRTDEDQNRKALVGRFIISTFLDFLAVVLLITTIILVLILFKKSLFEGFISAVAGFFLVKFIFINRSGDFLSKFQGWL